DEDRVKNSSQKNNLRIIFLFIVYIISMVVIFIVLFYFEVNSFLIIIILAFISLLILGSILKRRKQKSLYSKLYPEKKQNMIQRPQRKLELTIKAEEAPVEKKFREVNLNFKYRKTLINKCENCGMIITSYKKNCPICGKAIELKGIITKCKKCGMTIPKSAKKCPVCGTRIT
ncbi:MAG: zinc ribbon domain-containing protein, partial [Candidatus Hermodarchaeota archaeon]